MKCADLSKCFVRASAADRLRIIRKNHFEQRFEVYFEILNRHDEEIENEVINVHCISFANGWAI